jgi:DMSO/TMAO reductase YedYZ molybdopterin-dependent catalytic subunit
MTQPNWRSRGRAGLAGRLGRADRPSREGRRGRGSGIPGPLIGALCGLITGAVAMGVAQLLAGLSIPQASPVLAVGQAAIGLTPPPVVHWATATFGTHDKTVLLTGVWVVLFCYAAVIGVLAVRRLWVGMAGIAVFAAIGVAATLTRAHATAGYALPTVVGALVAAFVLHRLVMTARAAALSAAGTAALPPIVFGAGSAGDGRGSGDAGGAGSAAGAGGPGGELRAPDLPALPGQTRPPELSGEVRPPDPPGSNVPPLRPAPSASAVSADRRAFLTTSGVALVGAAATGLFGRELATRHNVSAARSAVRLPRPSVPAPPLPAGVNLPVPGISSFITPNSQFYRIDTALFVPQVDPSNWQLRIHGMVSRPLTVTFDELLRRPLIEDYVTLCCVSNPVGGPLISNAKFLGASYASLIREAGPLRGADQLLCTSVDGFTSGTPLSVVLDGRDSLIAVAMNGTALPVEHGFPARLVVPGLYGYVSACKWVVDIEVTTFRSAVAYWAQNGWSQQAPIKTESRIDVPAPGSQLKAGRVTVAGVAWAQHKGIEAVEVRVDNGQWQRATLAAVPDLDTWRQWAWDWPDATVGQHLIEARATDKTGYTQTAVQEPPAPNGATGYPMSRITVVQ